MEGAKYVSSTTQNQIFWWFFFSWAVQAWLRGRNGHMHLLEALKTSTKSTSKYKDWPKHGYFFGIFSFLQNSFCLSSPDWSMPVLDRVARTHFCCQLQIHHRNWGEMSELPGGTGRPLFTRSIPALPVPVHPGWVSPTAPQQVMFSFQDEGFSPSSENSGWNCLSSPGALNSKETSTTGQPAMVLFRSSSI